MPQPPMALQRATLLAIGASLVIPGIPLLAHQEPPTFRTGVEAVALYVSVLDRDGLPVRRLVAADYTVDLPVAGLQPGPRLLTIEATKGARIERREVTFVVR